MRNPWKLTSLLLALVLAGLIVAHLAPGARAADRTPPRTRAALTATQSALRQLAKAPESREAGHRVKAQFLLGEAEKELKASIAAGEP